jgi:hypothetical protein
MGVVAGVAAQALERFMASGAVVFSGWQPVSAPPVNRLRTDDNAA